MTDQCNNCLLKGDLESCQADGCFHHENWYARQMQARAKELEAANAALTADTLSMAAEVMIMREQIEELTRINEELQARLSDPFIVSR